MHMKQGIGQQKLAALACEEQENSYQQRLQELAAKYEQELQEQESNYQQRLQELAAKYEQKLQEQESNYQQRLQELAAKYEQKLQEQESNYQQHLQELAAKYEQKLKEQESNYQQHLQELAAKYEQKLQEQESNYQHHLQTVEQHLRQAHARIAELERRLSKDSHNSSKPPSSDGLRRKTRSQRKPSGKKSGGQVGHPGVTLSMVASPDAVVSHRAACCQQCGTDLQALGGPVGERRQVHDLPDIPFQC